MYCLTESFWDDEVFSAAESVTPADAVQQITARIHEIQPAAESSKITRFIYGQAR
jgi:hypothetical protein